MFAGHFGVGFGAKPAAQRVSLGTLFLAAQFVDLLWPTLLLLGWETAEVSPGITRVTPIDFTYYPISHSLLAVTVWSLLFAGGYYLARRSARGALVCALLVLSHWFLDALSHRPDLPLAPGSEIRVGLGLWNSVPAAVAVELLVFGVGVTLYGRATRPSSRAGNVGFWALVAFLVVMYAANVFGPPPPDLRAIAWTGHAQWLLVGWAWWVDRHREPRSLLPRL